MLVCVAHRDLVVQHRVERMEMADVEVVIPDEFDDEGAPLTKIEKRPTGKMNVTFITAEENKTEAQQKGKRCWKCGARMVPEEDLD